MPERVLERCLPDELKALRQWVIWRYEPRPGKDKSAKGPIAGLLSMFC